MQRNIKSSLSYLWVKTPRIKLACVRKSNMKEIAAKEG
jgi:hypothetical protein